MLELLTKDPSELSPSEYSRVRLLGMQFLVTTEWSFDEAIRSGDDLDEYAKRVGSVIYRDELHYGALIAWPVFRETGNPDYVRWFEEKVLESVGETAYGRSCLREAGAFRTSCKH